MLRLPKTLNQNEQNQLLQIKDQPEAKEKLILGNLRLVMAVAVRYYRKGENEVEDLFQTGVLGLYEALDKYDPARGAAFSTIATWYIKNAIRKDMLSIGQDISLDAPIGDEEDSTLQDIISDPEATAVDEEATGSVFIEQWKKHFENWLSQKEYQAFILRYGVFGRQRQVKEIAALLEVEQREAQLLIDSAIKKMRKSDFIRQIRDEVEDRTTYCFARDYSVPRTKGGERTSMVERVVIAREEMFERILTGKLRQKLHDIQ